jgi:hypothetical protein
MINYDSTNYNSTNPFVQAALNCITAEKTPPRLAKLVNLLAVEEPMLSPFNLECAAKEALRQAKQVRRGKRQDARYAKHEAVRQAEQMRREKREDARIGDACRGEEIEARRIAGREAFRIFDEKAEAIRAAVVAGREWLRRHRAQRKLAA